MSKPVWTEMALPIPMVSMEMELETDKRVEITTFILLSNIPKPTVTQHHPIQHLTTIPPFSLIVSIARQMGTYILMPLVRLQWPNSIIGANEQISWRSLEVVMQ